METNGRNIPAGNNSGETLTAPRFDEETEAAARPVVPLDTTRSASGTSRRIMNPWPRGVLLALAISGVVGIAAILIYRNTGTNEPSATPPAVSETIIKAVPEPASLPPSNQPARAQVPDAPERAQREVEPQTVLTVSGEPVKQELKEPENRDDEHEEKTAERARKEERKRLKRQRKEAEKLAEDARDSDNSDEPKPRLVGVYTIRRKH
jgi:type IV secretory pathway VirB10-like protein